MFIYAVHGNTIKFFGIIGVAIVTLALLIAFIPSGNGNDAGNIEPKQGIAEPTVPVSPNADASADNISVGSLTGQTGSGAANAQTQKAAGANDSTDAARSVSFEKVKTNEDRIALIASYGWEVEATAVEEAKVTIPAEFDRVMESYNEIQRSQGLDLSKYRNRDMMRYTYRITNYPDYNGTVYCNLLIYKNRVVAADICSSDVNGFISGLSGIGGTGGSGGADGAQH